MNTAQPREPLIQGAPPKSRLLRRLVVAIVLLIAIGLPVATFSIAYHARGAVLQTKADVKAEFVSQAIALSPRMWRFEQVRLRDVMTRFPQELADEQARVISDTGEEITTSNHRIAPPMISRTAPIYDSGVRAGHVEVRRSLHDILLQTLAAAGAGILLASGMFGMMRRLELREKRAVRAMFDERERARITLHAISDGVITVNLAQRIEYLNPAAERLTQWPLAEALGRPLGEICTLVDETTMAPAATPLLAAMEEDRVQGFSGKETALMRRDGSSLAIEESAAPIRNAEGGVIGGVMVLHDVSLTRRMEKRALWDATHDLLTGLANRRDFEARIDASLARARATGEQDVFCYLDLDQFKIVNDNCGHSAGDALLKQISGVLHGRLRRSDSLARLGGDEFGVLIENCAIERAQAIANDLLTAVREYRFLWDGKSFGIGVSIGLVAITGETGSRADVFAAVDAACYAAKEQGRNRVCVYRSSDSDIAQRRSEMNWAARLTEAIEADRLALYYQPYQPLNDGVAANGPHLEVLLRLVEADGAIVLPGVFLPAAERYGIMPSIDRWVISHVFSRYHGLCSRFGEGLTCAINLSGATLNAGGILEFIREQAAAHAIPPGAICFEITETAAINNIRAALQFMTATKALGFHFALDDFGVGTSSLAYLKTLPVDYLKIDGSFVRNIVSDPIDRAMTETINRVGHLMGLQTVGEYAASTEIIAALAEIGVDFAQGFAVQEPEPLPPPMVSGSF
jgi:diguanylate cyclase (GGDEF)-like protein/PAS domain S-box-containing protein